MKNILGISCFYHDSAACLVQDGKIVAAAQEERFTRKKHDFDFPTSAAAWCLRYQRISAKELDLVVFYEKPFIKFERILETSLAYAPTGIRPFLQAMPLWLKQKLWTPDIIRKELGYDGRVLFAGHHESHAAGAFYPSPFQEAAYLTMDGVGEWETASFGIGKGNLLETDSHLDFPHSLGLLYSAFTYYTGFKVNSGEYKLMGLAPYGEPKYTELILDKLIDLKPDGSFKLDMKYFGYGNGLRMTNKNFDVLFQGPPRKPETKITQKHMDIASSIQKVTEEVMLRMARHVHKETGMDKLCLAGGVSLNCVGNGRLLREGPFKQIWVQPASGDAGCALGAALLAWYKYLGNRRQADEKNDCQKGSFLGPSFTDGEIESYLKQEGAPYRKLELTKIPQTASRLLAQGKIIGWFQGRMEYGPRALGGRSILGDPRDPQMQSRMNLKIKFRESFRPFAPAVLREKASQWFDLEAESPYMLIVAPVKEDKRIVSSQDAKSAGGFDKLKEARSAIPAVTHVDYSARVQTVKKEEAPLFYELLQAFGQETGCFVLINTSFNVRGEPLVCTPKDAFTCFMRTEIDYLMMGRFLLDKNEQKPMKQDSDWQRTFELD
jgi:carbamoyltransferase